MGKIHEAAKKGDLQKVERLLRGGLLRKPADVNEVDSSSGDTPLAIAVAEGHVELVRLLRHRGGDIDRAGRSGDRPLAIAVAEGHVELARLLIEWGANVNASTGNDTSLNLAIKRGYLDLAKLLVEKGADAGPRDVSLAAVVPKGNTELVKLLLERGAGLHWPDGSDDKLLGIAVAIGKTELVKLFLARGADINGASGSDDVPLAKAVAKGHVDLARLLIEWGAAVNLSAHGETPLHLAVQEGHAELVRLLIRKGADISAAGKYGNSPLHYAFMGGACRLEAATLLLGAGADVNARNARGWRPIHVASGNADPRGVSFLVEHGADPGAASDDGTTPLHHASAVGHTEVMRVLLRAGAQIDASDAEGFTPLSAASSLGKRESVALLRIESLLRARQESSERASTGAEPERNTDRAMTEQDELTGVDSARRYYNKQWNFSLVYPSDWELLWENRPQGSWVMAAAVAGKPGVSVRPGLIVNARRGEVLEGSSQAPKTPGEFIEKSKQDLKAAFPDFRFLSGEEIQLSNRPAARVVYSYDTGGGRMQEMCVTIFGVGVTFQITCEVAPDEFSRLKPTFDAIISSFSIGSEPALEVEATCTAQRPETDTPVQLYNEGVSLYQKGQFEAAMETFQRVLSSGQLVMQSAYARGLCQRELGRAVEIPSGLGDRAEDAGAVYVAGNLACHLIAKGHKAALTKEGSTSEVTALVDGSLYVISISSLLGGFEAWAWRKEGERGISVPDPDANPNPTRTDEFVISLAGQAGVLPPSPMPEGGLKRTWE